MNKLTSFKTWLQKVSFLTEADCQLFEPYLQIREIPAKGYYLQQDQICRELGFVNSGSFRTFYQLDGKEINTHFCFESEFVVDYDSFLHEKPGRYYIQALETAEIVTFNRNALITAYQQSHNWERFGRMMAEYSYQLTTKRVESFMFLDAEQRYLQMLAETPHYLERIPLYHLASYLGIERESLSRLRKKLAS